MSYYINTKKLLIQGKPLLLFSEAKEIIVELVDYNDIPKILNQNYGLSINSEIIKEQAAEMLPNTLSKIWTDKLKKCILQAVYDMNIDIEMIDYTALTFNAYRALEGHLRYVLKKCGINLKGTAFNIFETNARSIKEDLKTDIYNTMSDRSKANKTIKYIEETYNYFGNKRHHYFHWNNPNPIGIDDTPMIENRIVAQELIKESLLLIEEYFKEF